MYLLCQTSILIPHSTVKNLYHILTIEHLEENSVQPHQYSKKIHIPAEAVNLGLIPMQNRDDSSPGP